MSKNPNLVTLRALRALPENSYGAAARVLLLAYCLLRGRTIDRLESPNSDPYAFPYPGTVADLLEHVRDLDRYTVVGSTVFVQVYPDSGVRETLARGRFTPAEWPR